MKLFSYRAKSTGILRHVYLGFRVGLPPHQFPNSKWQYFRNWLWSMTPGLFYGYDSTDEAMIDIFGGEE